MCVKSHKRIEYKIIDIEITQNIFHFSVSDVSISIINTEKD